MKSGVYTITNRLNGKIYIGESKDVKTRLRKHKEMLIRGAHQNIHLQRSVNKYGIESFEFEILHFCEEEYTKSFENYWCNLLNVHNDKYGYNFRDTHPHTLGRPNRESIEKSASKHRGKKRSKESIQKGVETRRKTTEERGYYHSPESLKKLRESNKGRKLSPEHIEKMRKLFTGRPNPKNAEKLSKPVIKYDLDNNIIIEYESLKEACKKEKAFIGEYVRQEKIHKEKFIFKYKNKII